MAVDTPFSRGFIVIIFWTPFQASGVRTHPLVSHSPVWRTLNEAEQQAVFRFAQRSPAEWWAFTAVPGGNISQAQNCAKPSCLILRAALTSR
jgi:hypothetical protein